MVSIIAKVLAKLGLGKLAKVIAKFIWNRILKYVTKEILADTGHVLGWLHDAAYDAGAAVSQKGNELAKKAKIPSAYEKYIEPQFLTTVNEFKRGLKEQSGP